MDILPHCSFVPNSTNITMLQFALYRRRYKAKAMRAFKFAIIVLFAAIDTSFGMEPLFIIKVHDDYLLVDDNNVQSIYEIKDYLSKMKSPNEVYVHAHVCLNADRLNILIKDLSASYKIHLSSYGSQSDKDCH